jgi:hypothetical protein
LALAAFGGTPQLSTVGVADSEISLLKVAVLVAVTMVQTILSAVVTLVPAITTEKVIISLPKASMVGFLIKELVVAVGLVLLGQTGLLDMLLEPVALDFRLVLQVPP